MLKRVALAILLTLLLASVLTLSFGIQTTKTKVRKTTIHVQSIVGVITDSMGDVTIEDETSANFDITKVSLLFNQTNLIIKFEVKGVFTQGGYFVLFDTDQNISTGCSGYTELEDFVGTDYFIHFNPINVPSAQLCSSYRPWVRVKELQYTLNGNVVTFYLTLSDIGFADDSIQFDVVASTFLQTDGKIYRDRAPDLGVFTIAISHIHAMVDIHPEALNLISKGRWVTGYIEFPDGYDVNDINVSMIMLNGSIPAETEPTAIGDYDNDTIPDLMVKFDRAQITSYILANSNTMQLFNKRFAIVTLTITGYTNNGTLFKGIDAIKTIR